MASWQPPGLSPSPPYACCLPLNPLRDLPAASPVWNIRGRRPPGGPPCPENFRSTPTHSPVTTRVLTPSHFQKSVQTPLRVKRRKNSRLQDGAPCAAALFDHDRHGSHSERRSCCRAGKRRYAGACQDLQWAPDTQPAPDICVRMFTAELPARLVEGSDGNPSPVAQTPAPDLPVSPPGTSSRLTRMMIELPSPTRL